jgi:hypothetical protein
VFDILVSAGWLENLTDHPGDPIKSLQWRKDANDPETDGYARFMAFNLLYSQLCRFGPITADDLQIMAVLQKELNSN